ncbi:HEPN domain-containing protein [Paraclostridium sordellii]|uniref:HEPN domain-containing protein n=1 Tax=Paraclostridium sordellii TaxID=1505 RepID=UPI0018CDC466|nr:HEPN domain-containing protein [Paeniclostridium sordellii]
MRKLLTKFMLVNVGVNWHKKNIPSKITNKQNGRDRKRDNQGYLYNIDFIDLSTFLFDEYSTSNIEELKKLLEKTSDISAEDLNQFIPKSNWDRYFKNIVNTNNLKTNWKELYDLRCKVAHNNILSKKEYEIICKLVEDMKKILEKAIQELDSIEIKEDDKEILAENIAIFRTKLLGEYIIEYKKIESLLKELLTINGYNYKEYNTVINTLKILKDKGIIDENDYKDINAIRYIRNKMIHELDEYPDENLIKEELYKLKSEQEYLLKKIKEYKEELLKEEYDKNEND